MTPDILWRGSPSDAYDTKLIERVAEKKVTGMREDVFPAEFGEDLDAHDLHVECRLGWIATQAVDGRVNEITLTGEGPTLERQPVSLFACL